MKNVLKKIIFSFAISIGIFSVTEGMEEQIRTKVNKILEQFHRNMEEYYRRTRVKKETTISVKMETAENGEEQPGKRKIEWQELPIEPQLEKMTDGTGSVETFTNRLQGENDVKPHVPNRGLGVYNPKKAVKQEATENVGKQPAKRKAKWRNVPIELQWDDQIDHQTTPVEGQITKLLSDMKKIKYFIGKLQNEDNFKHLIQQSYGFNSKLESYFGEVLAEMEEYYKQQIRYENQFQSEPRKVLESGEVLERLYVTLMEAIEKRRSGVGKDPRDTWPGPKLTHGQCTNQWVLEFLMTLQKGQEIYYERLLLRRQNDVLKREQSLALEVKSGG